MLNAAARTSGQQSFLEFQIFLKDAYRKHDEIIALSNCRYCDQPIAAEDRDTTNGYWKVYGLGKQPKYPCHKACKVQGKAAEALACQAIDADCNDCKHFSRKTDGGQGMSSGLCLQFSKPTTACPQSCTRHACFEHRKIIN